MVYDGFSLYFISALIFLSFLLLTLNSCLLFHIFEIHHKVVILNVSLQYKPLWLQRPHFVLPLIHTTSFVMFCFPFLRNHLFSTTFCNFQSFSCGFSVVYLGTQRTEPMVFKKC